MENEPVLTPEAARLELRKIALGCDPEMDHSEADKLLCKVLRQQGFDGLVDAFESMEKWYA